MNKPNGYDEAQAFGEFETLPAGGHECIIKQVKCEKTKNGKEYLKVAFDIDEGEHKGFYQKKFDADTREEKKWSGVWAVFIEGYNSGTTNPRFKGLITSIEASNGKFKFDFDEQKLVGKKVGIVFRDEEFEGQDGEIHSSVKPFYAISYDKTEEVKIPKPKKLKKVENSASDPFADFDTDTDDSDDLPF